MSHWICHDCGVKYGTRISSASTYHDGDVDNPHDRCGWCGGRASLTQARDYGRPTARGHFETMDDVNQQQPPQMAYRDD